MSLTASLSTLSIGLAVLLAPPSLAPQDAAKAEVPEIPWVRTWRGALDEAATRNVPILVFVLKDGQAASESVRIDTLTHPTLLAYLQELAVPAAAHTGDDGYVHSPEVVEEGGRRAFVCPLYSGIECGDHDEVHAKARLHLDADDYPSAYLLGTDGKPWKGSGRVDPNEPGEIVRALAAAQKEIGKPMRRSVYLEAERRVDAGERAFAGGEIRKAIQALQKVEGDPSAPEPFRKRATEVLDGINQAGMAALREASRLLEQDREKGRKELRRIRKEFRGLEAGEKAKEALVEAGKAGKSGRDGKGDDS